MGNHDHSGGQCPFIEVMEVVGGKWRGTIIYCLSDGPSRFNELRSEISQITQKMLTQELRSLERDGLVHREQFPEIPPKVVYSLTDLGKTLIPIINTIDQWKSQHFKMVIKSQASYDNTNQVTQ